jgi:hypothetical protein
VPDEFAPLWSIDFRSSRGVSATTTRGVLLHRNVQAGDALAQQSHIAHADTAMNPIDPLAKFNIDPPRAIGFALGAGTAILAFLLLAPFLPSQSSQKMTSAAAPEPPPAKEDVSERPAVPDVSRVLGAKAPNADVSCEDQAWPYFDPACLKAAPPKESAASASAPSTDGVASPSDRTSSIGLPAATSTVLPDRHMAVTGEPALMPRTAVSSIVELPVPKTANAAPRKKSKAPLRPNTLRRD